jgi:hypothetical protein
MSTSWSEPRSGRLAGLLGHYATELLVLSIIGVIAIGLHPLSGAMMFTAPVVLLTLVLVSWLMMRRHDRRLCEMCMASMPLNPSATAIHFRRRFWMAHTGSERRFLLPYIAVLIGSNFAPGTSGRIFWAVMQASMIYLILSQGTHRRLQPWCPWCSDGGGGQERETPSTPGPQPHDHRQLV